MTLSKNTTMRNINTSATMSDMTKVIAMRERHQEHPTTACNMSLRSKIYDARQIIEKQFMDPPSLGRLAVLVGTNECTLKATFKQVFGTTVFKYLFDYRMELAVHYLEDSALPIADIGTRLGYDYPSHFCTAFRRKFGMSPSEYRLRV